MSGVTYLAGKIWAWNLLHYPGWGSVWIRLGMWFGDRVRGESGITCMDWGLWAGRFEADCSLSPTPRAQSHNHSPNPPQMAIRAMGSPGPTFTEFITQGIQHGFRIMFQDRLQLCLQNLNLAGKTCDSLQSIPP